MGSWCPVLWLSIWASAQHVYRPRRPTTTPLYPMVQHHLETFLAQAAETDPMGYGVASWVEKDLRAYRICSDCERVGAEGADPLLWPQRLYRIDPRRAPRRDVRCQ